jgi:hypothetical protein
VGAASQIADAPAAEKSKPMLKKETRLMTLNSFNIPADPTADDLALADDLHARLQCGDPLTKRFILVCIKAIKIFDHKQQRYGPANIAAFGEYGVLVRLHDKLARLINLTRTGQEPKDETRDDSWGDAMVYSAISLMCRWGWWPGVDRASVQP